MTTYMPNFIADGDQLVLETIDAQNAHRAELRQRIADLLGELGYELDSDDETADTVAWIFAPDVTGQDLIDVCTWDQQTLAEIPHDWAIWHGEIRCETCAVIRDRKVEDAGSWPACELGRDHNWTAWMRELDYGHCVNCGAHGPAPAASTAGERTNG